jgi:hypothetical protein
MRKYSKYIGKNLRVTFDPKDEATPVMVYGPKGTSATFFCATDVGELTGNSDDYYLTEWESKRLCDLTDEAEEMYQLAREGSTEYR